MSWSRWATPIPNCGAKPRRSRREIKAEEARFEETLARGLERFEELANQPAISADDAFALAATYGFPIELTVELAEERGQPVDVDGYRELMAEHREVSRGSVAESVRAIEGARTEFVGYEKTEVLTADRGARADEDGRFRAKLHESPFYAEGGGQVSDVGLIEHEETGARAELVGAVRAGDDQTLLFEGEGFAAGDRVRAVVSWSHRFPTMANHTATHLLHKALREELGDHVQPGWLGRSPGQAPLRLRARPGADAPKSATQSSGA